MGSTVTCSKIPNHYNNAVCSTDFNLNLEDFPQLPLILPVRNSVCFSNPIIKLFVLVPFAQVNPFVIVMFFQVNPLVLVLLVQVNSLEQKCSSKVKLLMLVQLVQFLVVVLVQVNVFVLLMLM